MSEFKTGDKVCIKIGAVVSEFGKAGTVVVKGEADDPFFGRIFTIAQLPVRYVALSSTDKNGNLLPLVHAGKRDVMLISDTAAISADDREKLCKNNEWKSAEDREKLLAEIMAPISAKDLKELAHSVQKAIWTLDKAIWTLDKAQDAIADTQDLLQGVLRMLE
jgi:hypothetical protein